MSVIDEIATERKRQIEKEGYDSKHDDLHGGGQLALAACCYASPAPLFVKEDRANAFVMRDPWPWDDCFDKRPSNGNVIRQPTMLGAQRRALLVKAGALIVAEIERLDRQSSAKAA